MTEVVPLDLDPSEIEKRDPVELQRWFSIIAQQQDAHTADPDNVPELTSAQCRFAITLTRILRRTNTGPAKARAPRKSKAPKMTQDDINKLFE